MSASAVLDFYFGATMLLQRILTNINQLGRQISKPHVRKQLEQIRDLANSLLGGEPVKGPVRSRDEAWANYQDAKELTNAEDTGQAPSEETGDTWIGDYGKLQDQLGQGENDRGCVDQEE